MNQLIHMVQIIENLKDVSRITAPLHLAVGIFDGVHIGHQAVIKTVVDAAESDSGVAGVLTFEPHPIRVLAPEIAPQRILTSLNHKKELLGRLGIELMIVVPFTKKFASQEAEFFLAEILSATENLETIAIGEGWKFGKQRRGDVALLEYFGGKHNIQIKAVPAVMLDGERVSSTRIRQKIRDGDMIAAATMLDREYTVLGTVIKGRQLGRTLGFPTANLRVYNEQLPCDGVWAVQVTLKNGEIYQGAGNLGMRPTVAGADAKRMLEVHLLDYSGDLYGCDMEVRFHKFVRAERKFASLDELKAQISEDVSLCRRLFLF